MAVTSSTKNRDGVGLPAPPNRDRQGAETLSRSNCDREGAASASNNPGCQPGDTILRSNGTCTLCGLPCSEPFCCSGCLNVYTILLESGALNGVTDPRDTELFRRSLELGLVSTQAPPLANNIPPDAAVEERLFKVSGMWCGSCAWLIEHTLRRLPGVADVSVFFTSDMLKVRYHPQFLPPGKLAERVTSLGYRIAEYEGDSSAAAADRQSLLLKLGVGAFLGINVMMLNLAVYLGYFNDLPDNLRRALPFLVMTLAAPVVFWSALPILRLAGRSILNRTLRMETLLALGIVSAYGYSVAEAIRGGSHIYFDIACAIVTLVLLGKFVERAAKDHSSRSITMMYRMLPRKARLWSDGCERFVAIEALRPGDIFVVKAGERIPADGVVTDGESHADESLLTGEPAPVAKSAGSKVAGGSVNQSGPLQIRATSVGDDSALAQIVHAVERALSTRSSLERLVDRISRAFVPAIVLFAVITGIAVSLNGASAGDALMRAITVLVIACPCALGIATPLALTAAVSAASQNGVLVADARVLDQVPRLDVVVLDKTGTVTHGDFELLEYDPQYVSVLASLERHSEHPIGRAIVREAELLEVAILDAQDVAVEKGCGIRGTVERHQLAIGNRKWIESIPHAIDDLAEAHETGGATVVFFSIDGITRGFLALGDRVRSEARTLVDDLHHRGLEVLLLSGDSAATTKQVAHAIHADRFIAGVLPDEKVNAVHALRAAGKRVAMLGDGINDAPALAVADLGIAMGSGSDLAMRAASMVLMHGNLSKLGTAFDIVDDTLRVVRQNLFWAFFYNILGITLAVAGWLNPIVAAGAMVTSSLFVIANSHRLTRRWGGRPAEVPDAPATQCA